LRLAERDKFMSEQEKAKSFMQELDQWTDAYVVEPLLTPHIFEDQMANCEPEIALVKKAIQEKVLESYRNGQAAGPRRSAAVDSEPAPYRPSWRRPQ
jgi:hypothetical protein